MQGRINQIVVNIIVSQIKANHPELLHENAEAVLDANFENGIPLEPYRLFLQNVRHACGGLPILKAGQGLYGVSDPLLFVLLNSDSIPLLIEKEARLGRFIHSRHVVRLNRSFHNGVALEHVSNETEAPLPEENLASAGLHISLLEQLGCNELRLRFPQSDAPNMWVFENGTFRQPSGEGGYQHWHFEWSSFSATRRPLPGLDALLLSGERREALTESPKIVMDILQVVQRDMGRTWTITDVAQSMGLSPRSLQRALSTNSTSFVNVITHWRLEEAIRLLSVTELSITEIGYICGFSDTSHFSRRFKAQYGMSPSAYPRKKM